MMIQLDNVTKVYHLGKVDVHALRGVSVQIETGEFAAIMGPSGSGKSTLMDSMMGLVDTKGSIKLAGQEMTRLDTSQIVKLGVGYAPERAHLFPYMNQTLDETDVAVWVAHQLAR